MHIYQERLCLVRAHMSQMWEAHQPQEVQAPHRALREVPQASHGTAAAGAGQLLHADVTRLPCFGRQLRDVLSLLASCRNSVDKTRTARSLGQRLRSLASQYLIRCRLAPGAIPNYPPSLKWLVKRDVWVPWSYRGQYAALSTYRRLAERQRPGFEITQTKVPARAPPTH
jgi:hypothetical protein